MYVMHHDDFIAHSSKLDSVSNLKLHAETLLNLIRIIVANVLHTQPKFILRVGLLFFHVFGDWSMVDPKVIVFEKT